MTLALDGVLSTGELDATARHLAALQQPNGMIPWFPGGHCDPWNLVETAMSTMIANRAADDCLANRPGNGAAALRTLEIVDKVYRQNGRTS